MILMKKDTGIYDLKSLTKLEISIGTMDGKSLRGLVKIITYVCLLI